MVGSARNSTPDQRGRFMARSPPCRRRHDDQQQRLLLNAATTPGSVTSIDLNDLASVRCERRCSAVPRQCGISARPARGSEGVAVLTTSRSAMLRWGRQAGDGGPGGGSGQHVARPGHGTIRRAPARWTRRLGRRLDRASPGNRCTQRSRATQPSSRYAARMYGFATARCRRRQGRDSLVESQPRWGSRGRRPLRRYVLSLRRSA